MAGAHALKQLALWLIQPWWNTSDAESYARNNYRALWLKLILLLLDVVLSCAGDRSNDFVVGLTNVSPLDSKPILLNYTVCGQYPGKVPLGATVTLTCHDNLTPFRYVVVHFPLTRILNVCEIQVHVKGMPEMLAVQSIVQYRPCGSNSIGSICCSLSVIMLSHGGGGWRHPRRPTSTYIWVEVGVLLGGESSQKL